MFIASLCSFSFSECMQILRLSGLCHIVNNAFIFDVYVCLIKPFFMFGMHANSMFILFGSPP